MFVAWIVFPLVLALLCVGCGLLLNRVSGGWLPGTLLAPCGLVVLIVVASFATATDATAELAAPAVVALAVAGFGLALPLPWQRVDGWASLAGVGTFAAYAAPVVLSGSATIAGYITLDDTATWFAMTDRLMEHGRSLAGLPPSTYEATLANYLAVGSPVGANLPLGIGGRLTGVDIAWLFQPLPRLPGGDAGTGRLRAHRPFARVTGTEGARCVRRGTAGAAVRVLDLERHEGDGRRRSARPAGRAGGGRPRAAGRPASTVPARVRERGLISVLTVGGLAWLAALLLPTLVVGIHLWGRQLLPAAAAFAGITLVLSIPSLLTAADFIRHTTADDVFTSDAELGNLVEPLNKLQLFGIWPAGDFRFDPSQLTATRVLIALVVAAALLGLYFAWRQRAWGLLLYVATVALGCAMIINRGSPWVDAKSLATGSPAFVLAGLVAGAWLVERRRLAAGVVVLAAIAGGVLWSNERAYQQVWLAPRPLLEELQGIGDRFAGQGPTLMTEYQIYGVRHFLRDMDPEGAPELRRRQIPLVNGELLEKGTAADIDEFQLGGVLEYRTLVLRRSGVASRPPSAYELASRGPYYEVWQQREGSRPILEHLPLGSARRPAAAAPCTEVRRLAGLAAANGGLLAAAVRPNPTVLLLASALHPAGWGTSDDPGILVPAGPGTVEARLDVRRAGRYSIGLGGSFRGELELTVDGTPTASTSHQLTTFGGYTPLGSVRLTAGVHSIALHYDDGGLRPGRSGAAFALGPLVLSRGDAARRVTYVQPEEADALCGRDLGLGDQGAVVEMDGRAGDGGPACVRHQGANVAAQRILSVAVGAFAPAQGQGKRDHHRTSHGVPSYGHGCAASRAVSG